MHALNEISFKQAVETVAEELISFDHYDGGSFIQTPLLYPGGTTVVVRVEQGEKFFVSDMGLGHQEAELMGASSAFSRHARSVAEAAGVRFDNQAFFVMEATREQLAGAVITIANCSQEAVAFAAYKVSERRTADATEILYDRLVSVFKGRRVSRNVEVVGASNYPWHVATLVSGASHGRPAIFEPVTKHYNSVVSVAAKFHDISLLERAPKRVSVVSDKADFGPWLSVLTQSGDVIGREVSDAVIEKMVA